MDLEITNSKKINEIQKINVEKNRSKTSLRMRYEAEVEIIKKKLGHLEEIRQNLGLSGRKITQILMVDPSAWARWTKDEASTPPHIWRALEWYMLIQEKHPMLKNSHWLQGIGFLNDKSANLNNANYIANDNSLNMNSDTLFINNEQIKAEIKESLLLFQAKFQKELQEEQAKLQNNLKIAKKRLVTLNAIFLLSFVIMAILILVYKH